MNVRIFIAVAAAATGLFAQEAPVAPVPPVAPVAPLAPLPSFDTFVDFEKMQAGLAKAQEALEKAQTGLEKGQFKALTKGDIAGVVNKGFDFFNYTDLSLFQKGAIPGPQPRPLVPGRLDNEYDQGTRALDDHRYDDAVRRFDTVINGKGPRADGALYWKAYALNREGRKDDALAAIATLRRDYAGSRWLNDAQALEVEVRQSSGQPVSPEQESNDDIKLMALNSLMNNDPDRAIPQIENILKGSSSPRLKDRALFVLTQNRSARAQQIIADYAKGAGNPDLQMRAIRYIGMSGAPNVAQQLAGYYAGTNDVAVKRQIIQSLMIARDKDVVFNLAKTEKDDSLRSMAIQQLGILQATDQLSQLYAGETSGDNKIQIIRSLMIAGASDKLLDLMKNEKDPRVRDEAVRNYARTRNANLDSLVSLYTTDSDAKAKIAIVDALAEHGDAKRMIDLARKESDVSVKQHIVNRLGSMRGNKEATDYFVEILNK